MGLLSRLLWDSLDRTRLFSCLIAIHFLDRSFDHSLDGQGVGRGKWGGEGIV